MTYGNPSGEIATKLGLDSPTPEAEALVNAIYQELAPVSDPNSVQLQTAIPRLYITLDTMKTLWLDVAIGLGFAIAGTPSPQSLVSVFTKALLALKLLNDDESELVHVILYLSKGKAYVTPLPEEILRVSYTDATLSIDDLMERLVKRGIAVRNNDAIKLVH